MTQVLADEVEPEPKNYGRPQDIIGDAIASWDEGTCDDQARAAIEALRDAGYVIVPFSIITRLVDLGIEAGRMMDREPSA